MTMKSITSGKLVEVKTKQRQNNVLETSTTDPLARRPDSSRPKSSQKHPARKRRGSEVEGTKAPPSDQIFDLSVGTTADPMPTLEEQRRGIDHIVVSVNMLQQDMLSLRESVETLKDRRDQSSQGLAGDVNIFKDNHTKVSSSLSELDALKLEMKTMQQRIKRVEDSRSTGRRSPTIPVSAQVSRRPSAIIDEQAIPRNDASSNGLLCSATQTPKSAKFDGFSVPQKTVSERHDVADRGHSSSHGLSLGSKAEALPLQKPFTARPGIPINSTASRGSHTALKMSPPQIPRKGPEQNIISRRRSTTNNVAIPRTASITGTTKSTILPRITSQVQEASTSPHYDQEDHEYDDELVDDVRPQSSTGSFTRNSWQPASNTAQARQNRAYESAQQLPPKIHRRKSVPMPLPTPESSNKYHPARGRTTHHDSKRRKTTAFDANTRSTSTWAVDSRESRSNSSRRDEGFAVRVNGEVDGKSARSQSLKSKGRKAPGERDKDGYLLRPDGTRNPWSVRSMDQWKKKKAETELSE